MHNRFQILFWFNPLVYMYQNRMAQLHEFLADAKAINNASKPENNKTAIDPIQTGMPP